MSARHDTSPAATDHEISLAYAADLGRVTWLVEHLLAEIIHGRPAVRGLVAETCQGLGIGSRDLSDVTLAQVEAWAAGPVR